MPTITFDSSACKRLVTVMSPQDAITRWAAAWSAHDVEALLALFTDDIVYEDVPMGVSVSGMVELRAFFRRVLSDLPDITFELISSSDDGDRGHAEWTMRGTRLGTSVEVRGVSVFEFADGKIRRCSDYWDMATYLKQLGLADKG